MATTLMKDRIPCRYVIVKYVEDEVRDEPINVGLILQSNRDYATFSKFITEYSSSKLKNVSGENIVLLKEIWSNIERTISSKHKEKNTLDTILSKFKENSGSVNPEEHWYRIYLMRFNTYLIDM